MELKINCNAFVSLSKIIELEEVNSKISSYKLNNQTLSGDTIIYGKYIKDVKKTGDDVKGQSVEFEEIVPFTVLFNRENISIDSIEIEDFNYECVDESIKCSFVIKIIYEENVIEVPIETSYELKIGETNENIKNNEDAYEVLKEMNDEISEITDMLDEKLEEFFDEREEFEEENHDLEEEKKVIVPKYTNSDSCFIKKFKGDNKSVISIYYTNNPNDIEKIIKKENIGIDKLYKDNENLGLSNRIIVKK